MENILALLIPVVVGFLVLKFVMSQIGCLWKLIVNSLSGFLCLWLLNTASSFTGIAFPMNAVTVLTAGILGLPGIGLLAVLAVL